MESVMQEIRRAREEKNSVRANVVIYETVLDGCQIKMKFSDKSDSSIIESIRSMLLSARFNSMLTTAQTGGETS